MRCRRIELVSLGAPVKVADVGQEQEHGFGPRESSFVDVHCTKGVNSRG